jgi:ADP-heptose:LPS heptosyltransferase
MEKEKIKKILIVKFCCFGDVVFLTPTIESLENNFPGSHFTFLHGPWIRTMVKYIGGIDSNIEFDLKENSNIFIKAIRAIKLILLLRKEKFDLVFLGHRSSLFGIILFLAGIKYRFGFKGTKFINYSAEFENNTREVNRYLNILKENGLRIFSEKVKLIKKSKEELSKACPEFINDTFILGVFPFGGINPGTDMEIKRWGNENYISLVKKVSDTYKEIMIIIFEGKESSEKLPSVELPENVFVETINTDLISLCKVFISGDTGPLHIADGFGVSTISLFGPSNPELVAPVSDEDLKNIYIWKKPECSPCYTTETAIDRTNKKYWRGNRFICYTGEHTCMKEISVEEVFESVSKLIN